MKSDAIRVVINTPAKSGLFDYSVPPELSGKICPGQMVIVPFNHRIHQGVVWQTGVTAEVKKLLAIRGLSDPLPVLTGAQMKLAEKIAERSLSPIHECVNLLLTDKIRRISDPVYHLLKTDIPFQAGFSASAGDAGSKDAVFGLFAENGGILTEKDLDRTLGKAVWKAAMQALIESGVVEKTFQIDSTGPAPKMPAGRRT